jgi:hypothetical protein
MVQRLLRFQKWEEDIENLMQMAGFEEALPKDI